MSETRARMIEVGARLLRRQGFHATTLVQVVDEGGLPRGSIYHHFPGGKPELALEAIRYAAAQADADLEWVAAKADSARQAVALYVELLADRLEDSGYLDGCWYAATALEVAPSDATLADALSAEFARWQAAVVAALAAWDVDERDADARAALLIAAVEGALLRARLDRSTAGLRALVPLLQDAVDPTLPSE